MPRCYAARTGLVRLVGRLPVGMGAPSDTAALGDQLVGRLPVGMGALSDTAALGDRRTSVLQRSCSASDEGLR